MVALKYVLKEYLVEFVETVIGTIMMLVLYAGN